MGAPKLAARQEVNALLEALGLIVLARPEGPEARTPDESALVAAP
jgi:hypothetical protein